MDLFAYRRTLIVQPHPDDNELCVGGTVARLIREGCAVTYATITDGSRGSLDPAADPIAVSSTRRSEQDAALRTLGGGEHLWLGFQDGGPHDHDLLRRAIVDAIRTVQPDLVVTCDPWLTYEAHSDHRSCGFAVAEAVLLAGHIGFGDPAQPPFSPVAVAFYATERPNTVVDVSAFWDLKLAALACHRSQFEAGVQVHVDRLSLHAETWGRHQGVARAEVLRVMPRSDLHLNLPLPGDGPPTPA